MLEKRGLVGEVKVVTTDLFRELLPLIEEGRVLATVRQRPFTQGMLALENLLVYYLRDRRPQPVVQLAPRVISRTNLTLFTSQIAKSTEEDIEAKPRER